VLIADYWVVRRSRLGLEDLYLVDGAYAYRKGWNLAAVLATLVGCGLAWGGLFVAAFRPLYDYAWFVGFAAAFVVYVLLERGSRLPSSDLRPETRP